MLDGQVEYRLSKVLDQFAGLRCVARGRQLVVNCQAHIMSLSFMVQCFGRSVTHEMALASSQRGRTCSKGVSEGCKNDPTTIPQMNHQTAVGEKGRLFDFPLALIGFCRYPPSTQIWQKH
jgi:hypothetical protein